MGKYTFEGLQTSLEGVPQTQFFLTGKNLPGPLKKPSEQPKPDPVTSALKSQTPSEPEDVSSATEDLPAVVPPEGFSAEEWEELGRLY